MCRTGDYYLARSAGGDFVVQARQAPCSTTAKCNVALRIRYGTSLIGFDVDYRYGGKALARLLEALLLLSLLLLFVVFAL